MIGIKQWSLIKYLIALILFENKTKTLCFKVISFNPETKIDLIVTES